MIGRNGVTNLPLASGVGYGRLCPFSAEAAKSIASLEVNDFKIMGR
jgi:hypothetical protein